MSTTDDPFEQEEERRQDERDKAERRAQHAPPRCTCGTRADSLHQPLNHHPSCPRAGLTRDREGARRDDE